MLNLTDIITIRRRRKSTLERSPGQFVRRSLVGCLVLINLSVALIFSSSAIIYFDITRDLPSLETLPILLEPPDGLLLNPTGLYDRSGRHLLISLENPAAADRRYLHYDEIPPDLINATIAASDPGFWVHPGITMEIGVFTRRPSIAQRLVSDFLLWNEPPGLRREIRERWMSIHLTSLYGREKILEWYLNSADYGKFSHGIDAAARTYLSKPAIDLNLSEAALMAVVGEFPMLNPIDAPHISLARRDALLQQMLAQGMISKTQYNQAIESLPKFAEDAFVYHPVNATFIDLALEQLSKHLDPDRVARGGFKIITTIDFDYQSQASCIASLQVMRLEGMDARNNTAAGEELCDAAMLLPDLPNQVEPVNTPLAAEVVVLDPSSGELLAMAGGSSHEPDVPGFSSHTPGSLMTPFIYLFGFSQGMTPSSLLWYIPDESFKAEADEVIENYQFQGPVSLRQAMVNDYLNPALDLLAQLGAENVWRSASQFGLRTLETLSGDEAYRLPLEGGEVTLLEISRAYGVFANQGILAGRRYPDETKRKETNIQVDSPVILSIEDTTGNTWLNCQEQERECGSFSHPVISPQLVYLLNDILMDKPASLSNMERPNPLEIGRPVAAKIGTVLDGNQTWTVGYTPDILVGVWLGARSKENSVSISPHWASSIWHAIIRYATQDAPLAEWLVPSGIKRVEVCHPSGLLPTGDCPMVVREVFLEGTEPLHHDTLYQTLPVNRETGRLATIFSPSTAVEGRVFMIVPPEATDWAILAGVPTPPKEYDPIYLPSLPLDDVAITSPDMFAYAGSELDITGRAKGDQFSFYRIQVGRGLYPQEWLQIGEDNTTAVEDGLLAVWDTTGLNGLYTIQLVVVESEQKVQTSHVLVTIDNQPPQVSILRPQEGQQFTFPQESIIRLQAKAMDDLGLKTVEFYIDGTRVKTFHSPPFEMHWRAQIGQHEFRAVATDRAGNETEATSVFLVDR